ncbi:response regulator transcription factor [Actinoalloteichus hymeniacidonis]|uniref:Transcriptional regulatory protein CutR n=1 Tax=Actinoalloteichus hymeniacidonis TaxID=340345 RepID=A0AAC9MWU6_9PSEU|nr:response regulator transcription factor [Actinoalloteichus hymeniacidonis]AOS61381.1 Transcriptional regulatory protein CutR [Actinoalloteichus hymeniacidonis]MBB5910614.1 two-component system response regulator VanR [Actinoalloteichus hymeniacidonis]
MRVLVVEDEVYLADAIAAGLRREAMTPDIVHDGDSALEALAVDEYDVVVLDRDIPGTHGDDVCRQIVASPWKCRVLMLTAARRLEQKVTGFEIGADDYLAKPFEFPELVVRLRALNRRTGRDSPPLLELAGVRLDPFRREVYREGRLVRLSRKEFAVLEILLSAGGGVVSAEALLEKAWDRNADPFTNAIRVTISTLRKRLGQPWVIQTVPGVGYRVQDPARHV